ncbi:MAG: hypothetical protein Kow0063_07700 [Anaerolineae bacterium]
MTRSKRPIEGYFTPETWQRLLIRLGLSVGLLILALMLAARFG